MIIIEGPDLIGKTTLAKKIAKQLNEAGSPHVYAHLSRLPASWRDCAARLGPATTCVNLHLARASRYVVQDRFHMSEPMYAEARGEPPMLSPDEYAVLDGRLRGEHGMQTVLMFDASDGRLIESRWREDEMFTLDEVLKVNSRYAKLAASAAQTWSGYHMAHDLVLPLTLSCNSMDGLVSNFLANYCRRQLALRQQEWWRR